MDDLKTKQIFFNFPGVILSAFIVISLALLLPTQSNAKDQNRDQSQIDGQLAKTSWEQLVDSFAQMPDQKKLAVLIAVNVRAENYLTLDVRKEYEGTRQFSRMKISQIALEKAKILRV